MADPESAVRIPTVPIPAGPADASHPGSMPSSLSGPGVSPPPPSAVGVLVGPSPSSAVAPLPKRCPTCNNRYPIDFVVCPRDATTLDVEMDADADPLLGQVLGSTYRILRVVGEGGMGKVYEAQHLRIGHRKVAVKVLHPEYSRDRDVVSRFQKEAESASSITHPNVIQVFDVDVTPDGRPYLVGEFLEGEELGDHLERIGKVDIGTAVGIARQVCRALSAAHDRGVVHRDMKPENVFLTQRNRQHHIKVIDFGISKSGTGETHLTRTGMIIGTPAFMAPEQARGDKVDARADVYSTGAVLYTMITGQRPFDSDDPTATLTMVLTQDPTRPRDLEPNIPEGLELVVQRAMAKEAADRYQTMMDLEAALAPFDTMPAIVSAPIIEHHGDSTVISHHGLANAEGAQKAQTVVARAGQASHASSWALQREARQAKMARPTIVMLTATIAAWFLVGFVDALGGMVRIFRAGDITLSEAILLALGSGFLVLTPAVLYILHVRKVVWPNSVKALELANDLRRTAAAAFVGYGVAAILSRALETVVLRHSVDLDLGVWDAGLFVVSFLAALIAGGVGPVARIVRRKNG